SAPPPGARGGSGGPGSAPAGPWPCARRRATSGSGAWPRGGRRGTSTTGRPTPPGARGSAAGGGGVPPPAFPPSVDAWSRELREIRAVACVGSYAPRPLLVVHGSDDEVVPQFDARVVADAHGSAELRFILGAGHALRHDPRAVAVLLGWLDRQRHALRREHPVLSDPTGIGTREGVQKGVAS